MDLERAPNDPERLKETGGKEMSPLLKLALELGPLGVFFLFNSRGEQIAAALPQLAVFGGPIFLATAAFMVAIALSLGVSLWLTRRLPVMPLVSGVIVFVFGALTLWLHDELFIKLKPTIINTLFGVTLLAGLAFGKSLLGYVFDSAFRLTDEGWRILTLRWGLFFLFLAVVNEVVWRSFSTDFWVSFKVFGIMPITLVFTMFQLPLIQRHALPEPDAPDTRPDA
ncbi:septation protein A [Pannonibacter tanglangensis]|uniref:Inner membrane-spanning protein YciB n=1 Tax=Pannonibacter tanglangensis TaxID=2750084 RepID=A0ABW9ZNC9_9HYPH|nr:septation protein A [Pannonibacter sp. XCT-34]NBN65806.1 septation protein A [Pannonibacter sp. XCT-34]